VNPSFVKNKLPCSPLQGSFYLPGSGTRLTFGALYLQVKPGEKMKIKSFVLPLLVSLFLLTACVGSAVQPSSPTPDESRPGLSHISLEVGEEIYLEQAGFTLVLNAVTEDSRCPTTVRCIHAGWVTVDISMQENGEQTGQFFFTIPADYEGQSSQVIIDNVAIRLLEVRPYPNEPGGIPQETYEVVLEVVD
jgi:hypothetical protein